MPFNKLKVTGISLGDAAIAIGAKSANPIHIFEKARERVGERIMYQHEQARGGKSKRDGKLKEKDKEEKGVLGDLTTII